MTKICRYCNKVCKEETLPSVIGLLKSNTKDYVCDNPKCEHFGEVVDY